MAPQSDDSHSLGLKLFDEPHMAEIIVYIHHNPGCLKTDVYRNVARGDRMNAKLDILEREGIIEMTVSGRSASIWLTEMGDSIAGHLLGIEEIMTKDSYYRSSSRLLFEQLFKPIID